MTYHPHFKPQDDDQLQSDKLAVSLCDVYRYMFPYMCMYMLLPGHKMYILACTHTYTHTHTHTQTWIKDNNVLAIVFRDNLHQPQYVEKLDKLVRFCIKEKVLSLEDLDRIWSSQDGKHEIIVKNIHDMLVKLAWDFSPEQLEHLFGCFQVSCVSMWIWVFMYMHLCTCGFSHLNMCMCVMLICKCSCVYLQCHVLFPYSGVGLAPARSRGTNCLTS